DNSTLIACQQTKNPSKEAAILIANGKVVAWFQDRSEMGPRSLGNRSLLADPRLHAMADFLNLKVKNRESFRPYAPSILNEYIHEWFDLSLNSPFMSFVGKVLPDKRRLIPAVAHIDGTARLQSVYRDQNPLFYSLIDYFREITEVPLLLNTSFNLAGDPIVETPEDAIKCFLKSNIDCLFLHDKLITKVNSHSEGNYIRWSNKSLTE
ncbi:carbamoyltransferase, partial [bacterium]|nr:carbamoyltransferase [candidate division CSSED10-310 bacterium]